MKVALSSKPSMCFFTRLRTSDMPRRPRQHQPATTVSFRLSARRVAPWWATFVLMFCGCSDTVTTSSTAVVLNLRGEEVQLLDRTRDQTLVAIFMRTDCPIGNRYAPKISRLAAEFQSAELQFALVYPDPHESAKKIRQHLDTYSLDLAAYRDPHRTLVAQAQATVTPEAAVYDRQRRLIYRGRIDDQFVDFGKARPAPTKNDLRDVLVAIQEGREIEPATTRAIGCYIE